MKKVKLLSVIFVLVLFLAACNTSSPTPAHVPPTTETTQPYPAPQGTQAYPAPIQQNVVTGSSGYPAPNGQTSNVEWKAALDSINGLMTYRIEQSKDLKVTLFMKDGSTQVTSEPAFDDVRKVVQQCGNPCEYIEIVDK